MADMDELRRVLLWHAARYPALRPADAVKLAYQNEFGGGHLVSDPAESLRRLRAESAAAPRRADAPPWEDIGNGLVRVRLDTAEETWYPLEQLNADFVRSAALHTGDMGAFLEKLELLRTMAGEGAFGFPAGELEAYLRDYRAAGCPAVSHSAEYRAAYAPAYRVVARRVSLPLLLREAAALPKPAAVALDGRCAAGKSTLAARLSERFGWSVLHMDDFFLRPEQRTRERYETPGGNVDHERFLEEALRPLRAGALTAYRPFDCAALALGEAVPFRAAPVTLVEGSYACHPALRDFYDLRVFLTVGPEEQLRRIARRNGAEGARAFRERWIPLEERYFSAFSVEDDCDYDLELVTEGTT